MVIWTRIFYQLREELVDERQVALGALVEQIVLLVLVQLSKAVKNVALPCISKPALRIILIQYIRRRTSALGGGCTTLSHLFLI